MEKRQTGISVIICCYNSAKRIADVLNALAKQEFQSVVPWEILVIDNASVDNTAGAARSIWDHEEAGTTLRIIHEPKQGLIYARQKGIEEASFSYLVFCDDDNWLFPDYLETVYELFERDSSIIACGGIGIPVFETSKPVWFDEYAESFATGSQEMNREDGKILCLYGAGFSIRANAFDQLKTAQFKPLMHGRLGNKLSSSEDTELSYALVLMGQKLHFTPQLKFNHYLPKERLHFSYLKKLYIAFGNDGPVRNLYYANITNRYFHRQIRNWNVHFILSLFRLCKYFILPPKKWGRMIYFSWNKAYVRSLMSLRTKYSDIQKNIIAIKQIA